MFTVMKNLSSTKKTVRPETTKPAATDPRFANFETDPRFRLPSKNKHKIVLDKRFSHLFKDSDFTNISKFDRYGRKIKSNVKREALKRLYKAEEDQEEGTQNNKDHKDEDENVSDNVSLEADEVIPRGLQKAVKNYDPARGGGFTEYESEEDSSSDEDSEEEWVGFDDEDAESRASNMQKFREEAQGVEEGKVTRRIAIVNMDWDCIRSSDLMAMFSSFVPSGGGIEKISIYPSQFGKERMEREQNEGPPRELFMKKTKRERPAEDSGEEWEDERIKKSLLEDQEGDELDNVDKNALRAYQIDRLRYYYAIMICKDEYTARKIYEATDGSEFATSSNFLDLRFVPDKERFDEEARSECDSVPVRYVPYEFTTAALSHSKVELSWDGDNISRKESIKKAWTGSRKEVDENDLKAYLASDSDKSDFEEAGQDMDESSKSFNKKELTRRKLRMVLGLPDEPVAKSYRNEVVGDMEVTFAPALTNNIEKTTGDETTIEKYMRKERERKAKRKEMALGKRQGRDPHAGGDKDNINNAHEAEDLGFNDPFFHTVKDTDNLSKSRMRKEERLKKRAARKKDEAENKSEKARLALLMSDEQDERFNHFDMQEIMRAEKKKSKNSGENAKRETRGGLQEGFDIDLGDERFTSVFEDSAFAIDPSVPQFFTPGLKKFLEEGRKKRKAVDEEESKLAARIGKRKNERV